MKYSILWLDDEPDNIAVERDIIEDEFDDCGIEANVDIVKTLEECLQKLSAQTYHAVILDLQINLGPNADAVQQTWVGAGVYAWLRLSGDLTAIETLPDLVKSKLTENAFQPLSLNQNLPVAIVSGVAKSEVVTFIRDLNFGINKRPLLQVFDKPIDERKFTDFIAQVANKCAQNN